MFLGICSDLLANLCLLCALFSFLDSALVLVVGDGSELSMIDCFDVLFSYALMKFPTLTCRQACSFESFLVDLDLFLNEEMTVEAKFISSGSSVSPED